MSADKPITYAGPTGREKPGEHWNARIIREQHEAQINVLDIPAEAWAVLIDCPTPVNARKAVQVAVAAELERLVDETDWAWAVGESLRRRAAELRGDRKAGA